MAEKKSKLAQIKTRPTDVSVDGFIDTVENEQKRNDSRELLQMMKKISGEKPVLWSNSIVGFGLKRYKSPASGREVDWFRIGFAPRKSNITIYIISTSDHTAALEKLGKHKTGGGCVYINKLEDVNTKVLADILEVAWQKN